MQSPRAPQSQGSRSTQALFGMVLGALLIVAGIWWSTEQSAALQERVAALETPDHGAPRQPADGGDTATPRAKDDRERDWESVHQRLDGIEEALRGLSARLDAGPSRPQEARIPVDDGEATAQEALLAEVQALRREVTALRTAPERWPKAAGAGLPGEGVDRPLAALHGEHAEPRWDEVQRVMDLWRADEGSARRELLFQSSEDLLRTFGAPTETWSNDKGIHWLYGQGLDGEGNYLTELWICLKEDKVTMVGVK